MNRLRFVLVGGFLGSGKTTALLRLARMYAQRGKRVGIIANDLSEGLVDTATYQASGLPVEELPGVCFACRFDELLAAAGRLQDGHQPDVLLAEPAGSCTDIVSRVIQPLKALYADRFQVAPYVTLLDPLRAYPALTGKGPRAFSQKVTYLYKMQQNEADVVAINKADTLLPAQHYELTELVSRSFPKAQVLVVSARTGEGFDRLAAILDEQRPAGANPIDSETADQHLLAQGDAALGWACAALHLTASPAFDADLLLLDLAGAIQKALVVVDAEPLHVKMILRSGEYVAIANVIGGARPPELSRSCGRRMTAARLIVNARVEAEPAVLREQIQRAIALVTRRHAVDVRFSSIEACAPPERAAAACAVETVTRPSARARRGPSRWVNSRS